jgi:opacity protein-like surface antigen
MSVTLTTRRGAILAAGVAAFVGGTALAGAQVPTKPPPKDTAAKVTQAAKPKASTTQIKISKEGTAGGEVVPVTVVETIKHRDTVFMTVYAVNPKRDDSIRAAQHTLDSAAGALARARMMSQMQRRMAESQERMRLDAIARKEAEALALRRSLARGLYVGIAGGASAPQRALRHGDTGGYNVTVPFGYDGTALPWGIRADISVDHLNGTRIYNALNETQAASGDITVWSANTDVKLRIPTPGSSTRTHFYALAGVGAHRLTGGVYGTTDPNAGANLTYSNAKTKFGWNVGGGAAIAWDRPRSSSSRASSR